jgi:hypothetical protein
MRPLRPRYNCKKCDMICSNSADLLKHNLVLHSEKQCNNKQQTTNFENEVISKKYFCSCDICHICFETFELQYLHKISHQHNPYPFDYDDFDTKDNILRSEICDETNDDIEIVSQFNHNIEIDKDGQILATPWNYAILEKVSAQKNILISDIQSM